MELDLSICRLMFQKIVEKPEGWTFSVEVSYLEIYMETINDLLDTSNTNLDIRELKGEGVYVQGLSREVKNSNAILPPPITHYYLTDCWQS